VRSLIAGRQAEAPSRDPGADPAALPEAAGQELQASVEEATTMKRAMTILFGLVLAMLVPAVTLALEDGDWQVWNSETVEAKIAENWKLHVTEEFRLGGDASQIYEQFTEIGLARNLTGWFQLGMDYRHDYQRSGAAWRMEHRPQVNGTILWTLWGLNFKDRNRLERRLIEHKDGTWRYRNKLTVSLPAAIVGSVVRPYLAGEVFVELSEDEKDVNRYRLHVGFVRSLSKGIDVDLQYFLQSTESGAAWTDFHILKLGLKGRF
jgi:hypothetical protein